MVTEFLAYAEGATVSDVVDDLRKNVEQYRNYEVQYAYVVSPRKQLRGVLRLSVLYGTCPHPGELTTTVTAVLVVGLVAATALAYRPLILASARFTRPPSTRTRP